MKEQDGEEEETEGRNQTRGYEKKRRRNRKSLWSAES